MTARERYASACQSDDLLPTHADLHLIIAAGVAGRRNPLGVSWLRVHDGQDAREYRHAMGLLQRAVFRAVRRRHLRVNRSSPTEEQIHRVVHHVARWYLNPVCPHCYGRGREVIENTPVLGRICRTCHGSGRVCMDHVVGINVGMIWMPVAEVVREILLSCTGAAGSGMYKLMEERT